MKNIVTVSVLLVLSVASLTVFAAEDTAEKYPPVYSKNNVAINGYDTVAYFLENKPVKGSSRYSAVYYGVNWHFSSQEHLDYFIESPEKYLPQYGGYCAYAMARGTLAPVQSDIWTIHEDKLYLNYNRSVQQKWVVEKQNHISQADAEWEKKYTAVRR